MTTSVKISGVSPVNGATRMPPRPATAPPIVQVSIESRSGDQPSVAAARSFCADAVIASPTRVYLVNAHRTAVTTTAMPITISRSSCTLMPPHT